MNWLEIIIWTVFIFFVLSALILIIRKHILDYVKKKGIQKEKTKTIL